MKPALKERQRVEYVTRWACGRGSVVQVYYVEKRGWYVVLHDKARNLSVTVRPGQIVK